MQNIKKIIANNPLQNQNNINDFKMPESAIRLINEVVERLNGIYPSMNNTMSSFSLNSYKKQLTEAMIENNIVNINQVETGLRYFKKDAGNFPPSVGKFIQACSGKLEEQVKHPCLRVFKPEQTLNNYTEEDRQSNGKKLVKEIRVLINNKKALGSG